MPTSVTVGERLWYSLILRLWYLTRGWENKNKLRVDVMCAMLAWCRNASIDTRVSRIGPCTRLELEHITP